MLGPPGAATAGVGEDARMSTQFLMRGPTAEITVRLRCLQLQRRVVERSAGGGFRPTDEVVVDGRRLLSWDEAVEREPDPWTLTVGSLDSRTVPVDLPAGEDVEPVRDHRGEPAARLRRVRRPVHARLSARAEPVAGTDLIQVSIDAENRTAGVGADPNDAIAASLIGAHLLLSVTGGEFVSMTDPPPEAVAAAAGCVQHRCWPVLAGPAGDASLLLVSPIILYDHPEVAEQSAGSLFDATEIDEILTLRVMTMTDEEKAVARATDPKAAEIVDRCDTMSPEAMDLIHGVLRGPHAEQPWWDPAVDAAVDPATDAVCVDGVDVRAGSIVRLRPSRRADAHDIFYAGRLARVSAVHTDVDGATHIAVVVLDDPAAELHDWYGRYLHFAPEEIEPVDEEDARREESRR